MLSPGLRGRILPEPPAAKDSTGRTPSPPAVPHVEHFAINQTDDGIVWLPLPMPTPVAAKNGGNCHIHLFSANFLPTR